MQQIICMKNIQIHVSALYFQSWFFLFRKWILYVVDFKSTDEVSVQAKCIKFSNLNLSAKDHFSFAPIIFPSLNNLNHGLYDLRFPWKCRVSS